MDRLRIIGNLIVTTVCLGFAGQAGAETFNVDGVGFAKNNSKDYQVDETHMVRMNMSDYYRFESPDPANPFVGMAGSCFGEIEVKGATAAGDGYCTWTDGEGNTVLINWESTGVNDQGQNIGAWNIVGGTGRWQGAEGAGNYQYRLLQEDATEARNEITGSVTLAD